jgi:pyocin large subunit-like protein
MATSKPAKFSIVGVIAALIAVFFAKSGDQTPDAGSAPAANAPAVTPTPAPTVSPTPAAKPAPAAQPEAQKPVVQAPTSKPAPVPSSPPAAAKPAEAKPPASTSKVGFTSRASWQSHFEKHGAEFGKITADEYLEKAKALRDAPLSKDVLELVRKSDDVTTRFDKRTGIFVAFHDDKTIRTCFRPNDGEAYFRRQANQ